MLLVMSTAGLFGDVIETIAMETKGDVSSIQHTPQYQLWLLSWQRIEKFLPHLKVEIFPAARSAPSSPAVVAQPTVKVASVQQDEGSVTEQLVMTQLPKGESPPAGVYEMTEHDCYKVTAVMYCSLLSHTDTYTSIWVTSSQLMGCELFQCTEANTSLLQALGTSGARSRGSVVAMCQEVLYSS